MIFFWLRLKNASSLAFYAAAVMVPLTVLFLGSLFGGGRLNIQVGVYGDIDIAAVQYDDIKRLRQDVANRRLELGYALEDGQLHLYVSPATVTENVLNLLMAAAHLEGASGEVGARALRPFMEADAEALQARAEEFLADGPLMESILVVHGDGEYAEAVPFRRLFHGLLALFGQLVAMLCALGFSGAGEGSILRRLSKTAGAWYVFCGGAVIFAMTAAVMLAVIVSGAVFFPGVWTAGDAPAAVLYLLAVSAIALALAYKLPTGVYPAVLVLSFIFTALMGGVLFDLREVLEAAAWLRFLFPSYYYISATA